MTKLQFLLACGVALVLIICKMIFFAQEQEVLRSFWGVVDCGSVALCFLLGCWWYVRESRSTENILYSATPIAYILIALVVVTCSVSLLINMRSTSLDWDAIALYDARAQFMRGGMRLSEMTQLSQYDIKNRYYYLLYPPFTSILHYLWYSLGITLPITVLYNVMLVILALVVYCFALIKIGPIWSAFFVCAVVAYETIFNSSLSAYTNLPFTLFLVMGFFLLHDYLVSGEKWKAAFGVLLVIASQWIRYLEPTWLAAVLAFSFAFINKDNWKKSVPLSLIFLGFGVTQYLSWSHFVRSIGNSPAIFQVGVKNFMQPIVGIFTGAFMHMVWFFIRAWGFPLAVYGVALLKGVMANGQRTHQPTRGDIFFYWIIVLSACMYFAGLYFISFQVEWWPEMGGSLIRSSTFLWPIGVYLILKHIKNFKKGRRRRA
jgi:hypothetical protein